MSEETIKEVTCIVCPLGCAGKVRLINGAAEAVEGFTCKRGAIYAREEVTAPKRMLTTTVKVVGGESPLLPIVSDRPLPKGKLLDCVVFLHDQCVDAPIAEGTVIFPDILSLGVDIVAAKDVNVSVRPG